MKNKNNPSWQKQFVEIIDQRQRELPPAWVSMPSVSPALRGRGLAVFESGRSREMANSVVSLLSQARDKAVLSSFLLADKGIEDSIFEAAKRGVRVYVLLASEARLGREEGEGEFDKHVLDQHKAMLARLGGHVLFRSAPHFHAKLVVIDPETRPAGLLLTANLTTEALERNEELAVKLTSDEVIEVTGYLKWAMWEFAEHELIDPSDRLKATRPLGKVPHPAFGAAIVATTSETCDIRAEALRLMEIARSRIVVSSFGWDEDHSVVKRLCARAREGLNVTVLARIRPSSMPALLALADAGATVLGFRWLHAKAIWIDSGQSLVMSANLQRDGLDQGFELGLRFSDGRSKELLERLEGWCAAAQWRLEPKPLLGALLGAVRLWRQEQFVDAEIVSLADVDLGAVTAESAAAIESRRPQLPAEKGTPTSFAHELRCVWQVVAPTLAAKAKEQLRPAENTGQPATGYKPAVFCEPSGRVVVAVRSADELDQARAVMTEVKAATIVVAEGAH